MKLLRQSMASQRRSSVISLIFICCAISSTSSAQVGTNFKDSAEISNSDHNPSLCISDQYIMQSYFNTHTSLNDSEFRNFLLLQQCSDKIDPNIVPNRSSMQCSDKIGFRGFADSIFGLTVVYAGLIMYDAQGVRREVGKHARELNKLPSNARRSEVMSLKGNNESKALQSDKMSEEIAPPLKESIGHTEVEVIAGALFGFLVSFGVYSLM